MEYKELIRARYSCKAYDSRCEAAGQSLLPQGCRTDYKLSLIWKSLYSTATTRLNMSPLIRAVLTHAEL